ncbi:MAG: GNAT family N-acetyltransferase [Synergistaceae bacterium]|nr:GNAT family N-acetyltransferase [Synergistaceae bacterium]
MSYVIEFLADSHNRGAFDCGIESLNRYLRQQATQDIRRNVATVSVAATGIEIAGYYSLANTGISPDVLPDSLQKRMPRYQMLPAVLLGRLAVDLRHRGRRLGIGLLTDAFILSTKSPLAWALFLTEALDASAAAFYERFGFRRLKDNPRHLYITRQEITKGLNL